MPISDGNTMRKYLVVRKHDIIEVLLMKHKDTDTWSFVNLTKGHICPCKFDSVDQAISDMAHKDDVVRFERVW